MFSLNVCKTKSQCNVLVRSSYKVFKSDNKKKLTPCFRLITRCPRQLRDVAIVLCVLSVCFLKRTAVVSHDQDTHTYSTEIRKCLPTVFTCPYRTLRYRNRNSNKFSQGHSKMKLVSPLHIETSVTWICFSHGLPMFLSVAKKLTSFFFVIVKK
jgi:hypothetical protein